MLAAKDEVSKTDLANDVQESLNKANTAIQSVDGLATETYVGEQIAQIPTPDVSGQISTHDTNTAAHSDIRAAIPTKVSELTNDKGYLTEHQSLAGYAKTADLGDLAMKDKVAKDNLSTDVQTSLNSAAYINVTDNENITTDIEAAKDELKEYIDSELQTAKDSGEFDGKSAYQYAQEGGYAGTEAEFADDSNPDNIKAEANAYIAEELAKRGQLKPEFANDISECTDTSKLYVLPDGYIWAYKESNQHTTITERITEGFTDGARLSSSGGLDNGSSYSAYCVTPFIDVTKYPFPFTLHLKGNPWYQETNVNSYTTMATYNKDQTFIKRSALYGTNLNQFLKYDNIVDNTDGTCEITFNSTVKDVSGNELGYLRFCAIGTGASSNVYVTYEQSSYGYMWTNTGHAFVPADYETRIIELEEKTEHLEQQVFTPSSIESFSLVNPSVKAFEATAEYNSNDYSYNNITSLCGTEGYRKDIPLPVMIEWKHDKNAVDVVFDISDISGVYNSNLKTYYVDCNRIHLYNLIPNKTYYYTVVALYSDGTKRELKSGNFSTNSHRTRMLCIDGIQNVRDIGGYIGIGGQSVNYGLIYRGSAMDEKIAENLHITDKGKEELLLKVGVRSEIDLRGANNVSESILGNDVDFFTTPYSYLNYTSAITDAASKSNFKNIFEHIVAQLTDNKPVYIHCSGGCDRTGTVVFLLLGLLGVSESDLAKEYELSSFSNVGKKTRIRNSTTYDYSGMVATIKTYSGTTIADKFVSFATDCGISNETIISFRNLMFK